MKQITCKKNTWQYCFSVFIIISAPAFACSFLLQDNNQIAFHIILFATGWLSWTFTEYMIHRFWMHYRDKQHKKGTTGTHLYHHHHPTEIRITSFHRLLMTVIGGLMMILTIAMNNYFTMLTGFYFGLTGYFFIHFFLHQPWSRKIFKEQVTYHIYHHCKYPDHCFGITVTWWDKVFGTKAPKETAISQKIIDFYFSNHNKH